MRSKLVLAALFFLSTLPVFGQVAPAARVSGIPLGVGAGFTDYDLDYGQGRRMFGVSAWADYRIYRGLGIEIEGTTILGGKPSSLSRMRQDTIKGGVTYKYHQIFHVRPYGKFLYGLGSIDFPSRNPLYTHDTYSLWAAGGGLEYRLIRPVYLRADYEFQSWLDYRGNHTLNPNGFTIGATYYLPGARRGR